MSRASGVGIWVLVGLVATAMSGCLEEAANTALPDADHHHMMAEEGPFSFTAKNCYEAGFQALYTGQKTLATVWKTADAQKEYGNPIFDSGVTQLPLVPPAQANVHDGFKCETTVFDGQEFKDYTWGFVGDPILPPAWDPGGADYEFLLSFIGLANGTIYDAMDHVSTARISRVVDSSIEYLSGSIKDERFRVHEEFRTTENGVYMGTSDMVKYRDVAPRTIRFWWTVPADGSESHIGAHEGSDEHPDAKNLTWHPVYWDLKTKGGPEWSTPQYLGNNQGCHAGIDDHGPSGKACQPTQTSIWHHDEITLTLGPVIKDVTLKEYWFH